MSSFINTFLLQQSMSLSPYLLRSSPISSDDSYVNSNEDKENDKRLVSDGKKLRTTFTEKQKQALDSYYQCNAYPDPQQLEELSEQLSLSENVVKVWFQNKRSRNKQTKSISSKRIHHEVKNSQLINDLKFYSSNLFNNTNF